MKILLSLIFVIFSFNASSMEDEDIDKLKNQIFECYDENKSFANDSFDGKILKFKILVNEDKTIKELTTEEENPYFLEFLNKVFEKPDCNNLILTDNGYEIWNEINFSFDFSWQFDDFYQHNEQKSFNSINEVIQTIGEFKCERFGKFEILEKDKFITKMNFSTGDSKIDLVINWGAARCEDSASIFSSNGGTEYTFITNIEDFSLSELYEEFITTSLYNDETNGIYHFWIHDWEIIRIEGDDIFPEKWNIVKILKDGHNCEDKDLIVSGCYDYHIFYSIFAETYSKGYTDGIKLNNGNVILKLPSMTVDSNIILLPKKQQYDSLPNAGLIEVFDDEILFEGIKTYFNEGGAVWFDAIYDLDGEFIKYLTRDGDTACVPIKNLWEYENNQEAIEEQNINELCVWNWREDPGKFIDDKYNQTDLVKFDDVKDARNEDNCSGKRKVEIESKYVSDFRVDILNMDFDEFNEYCDDNRIIISSLKNNRIVLDDYIGSGANNIANFLEGQNFLLDEYVWIETCPGTIGCISYGYYFENGKEPIKFQNDKTDLINCKYQNEKSLQCSYITEREFNSTNSECSRAKFPYDTYNINISKNSYIKEIISEEPIPNECK